MGCCKYFFGTHFWCAHIVILLLVTLVCVEGQMPNSDGFINIDCGILSKTSYVDRLTGLTYLSDDQYIDTGINKNVSSLYTITDENYTNLETLRAFPNNIKNCYTLNPVTKGLQYLVRATFYYGNYDKTRNPPSFDLYFGVNFWSTVNISKSDQWYSYEIIAIAPANYIQVCLVNTEHGNPFISVLELRPLNPMLYSQANSSQSLNMIMRKDLGANYKDAMRYPRDPHDRLWFKWTDTSWTPISTNTSIVRGDFDVPSLVLQTAAVASSANGSIDIKWSATDNSTSFFVLLHIAEIQVVPNNSLREFYISRNGENILIPVPLTYLMLIDGSYTCNGYIDYNVSLKPTARATLPPILNAFELYIIIPTTWLPTEYGDVSAINAIKTSYNIRKDWIGDPCVPPFTWTGINCTIDDVSNISRIIVLNLSSSGLNGPFISDFGSLIALERLDLSHNSLSGNIPRSLDQLVSLTYLDLSGNNGLSRILPPGLQKKQNDSLLTVIFNKTVDDGTGHKKSSKAVIIIIIVAVIIVFLIGGAAALFIWYLKKKKKKTTKINPPTDHDIRQNFGMSISSNVLDNPKDPPLSKAGTKELNVDKRKFSYEELKVVTNNFSHQIGFGGFGKVFKGHLEDGTEVAVKVRSELSSQGVQQFLNEVENLSRVHHKNLVSLIGYCKDRDHIALVYEYMQNGSLQDWIGGSTQYLQWRQRLWIAYESAQGLEYLHKMCSPPLIHRDVKTTNILLTTNLEAKVSDFGLVRDCIGTHVSTQVVGTPGYLDPYYVSTSKLTEKSDVYSFGVVLLEIITGNSVIQQGPQKDLHLIQYVLQKLSKGNIESILDPNMGAKYNINSIWKVADLAIRCTDQPAKRPDLTAIVAELKETINLEMSSIETSSAASEDISQYNICGDVQDDNFKMAHIGGMQQPDSGPSAR